MTAELTYLLSPKFYFKRDGPIALGNIVADPFQPHYALTTVDEATLTQKYPKVETYTDFDQSLTENQDKTVSMSAWLKFLDTANKKISLVREKYRLDQYTMTSLETEQFVGLPSEQEIKSRINVGRIREYIRESEALASSQPLYMVTGRKLARGFHAAQGNANQVASNIDVQAATNHKERSLLIDQEAKDRLVFAYQLMRIVVSGQSGTKIECDRYTHERGFLDMDDDDEVQEDEDVEIEVDVSAATAIDLEMFIAEEDIMLMEEIGEGDEKLWLVSLQDEIVD